MHSRKFCTFRFLKIEDITSKGSCDFSCIFKHFSSFPTLFVGIAHSGSQPFIYFSKLLRLFSKYSSKPLRLFIL